MNHSHLRWLLVAALLVGHPSPGLAAITEVSACGQVVSGASVLTVDLDCLATGQDALVIQGGKLSLEGHEILGSVRCEGACSVEGPGALHGSSPMAPESSQALGGDHNVSVSNLVVTGRISSSKNISIQFGDIDALAGGGSGWISALKGVSVSDSTIVGTLYAHYGQARVSDSAISDGVVRGNRVKVRGSTITDSPGSGVEAERSAVVEDSTISNSAGHGVEAAVYNEHPRTLCYLFRGKARVSGTTISDSGGWGVYAFQSAGAHNSQILGSASGGVYAAGYRNGCFLDTIGSATVSSSVVDGGEVGVHAMFVQVADSTVTDWSHAGLYGFSVDAPGTTVASASLAPECGVSQDCPDVASVANPTGTIDCGVSQKALYFDTDYTPAALLEESWGVCAGD